MWNILQIAQIAFILTQHSWQALLARSQVENLHPPLTNQSRSAQEAGFSGILLAVILLHIFKHAL